MPDAATGGHVLHFAGPEYFAAIMPWLLTNGTSSFSEDWSKPTYDDPRVIEAASLDLATRVERFAHDVRLTSASARGKTERDLRAVGRQPPMVRVGVGIRAIDDVDDAGRAGARRQLGRDIGG